MKIIQVIPFFGLGGAEIMCENLVYELKKRGHEVVVLSLFRKKTPITERMEKAQVDIRYLDKKQGIDLSMYRKLKAIFKQEKPDIVHTHLYVAKYVFPVAAAMKIKVVHTLHSIAEKENGNMERKLNDFFFKHCRLIPVALSELVRDTVVREYGISKDKIPVIYNGVDLSKCLPKKDYAVDGNFKILHVGSFSEPKNHIGLLRAFKLFHDKHKDSELWLIGDGQKRAEIESFVNENDLVTSIKILGQQSNVFQFLRDADIFTLPSNYEGIPMSLIEAMGTGLPIVATAVGGVPDMLTHMENALVVENDVEKIAMAFESYYEDSTMRETFGQEAYKRANAFSASTMAKKYTDVYFQ